MSRIIPQSPINSAGVGLIIIVAALMGRVPSAASSDPLAMFRIDRGIPVGFNLTANEGRALRLVQAKLTDSARRDVAIAFVPSEHSRKMVVVIAPRSNFPYWAGARSLTDCDSRPGCRHYCAWYYVPKDRGLFLNTLEQNRCADSEPIWRQG